MSTYRRLFIRFVAWWIYGIPPRIWKQYEKQKEVAYVAEIRKLVDSTRYY